MDNDEKVEALKAMAEHLEDVILQIAYREAIIESQEETTVIH